MNTNNQDTIILLVTKIIKNLINKIKYNCNDSDLEENRQKFNKIIHFLINYHIINKNYDQHTQINNNYQIIYKLTEIYNNLKNIYSKCQRKKVTKKNIDEHSSIYQNYTIPNTQHTILSNIQQTTLSNLNDQQNTIIEYINRYINKDLLKEENDSNFGHEDVIIRGNGVQFSTNSNTIELSTNGYTGQMNYFSNQNNNRAYQNNNRAYQNNYLIGGKNGTSPSTSTTPPKIPPIDISSTDRPLNYFNKYKDELPTNGPINYFNKYEYIEKEIQKNNIIKEPNQKNFFNLYRYNLSEGNVPAPNSSDEPTLSISLFMDANALLKNNFDQFTNKYFQYQILLILSFKYYFPRGNVRIYFDKYLFDALEKMSGTDEKLILPVKIGNKFEYIDYEEDKGEKVKIYLQQYLEYVNMWNNTQFKSGLHRFLSYYDLASRAYSENDSFKINENGGDFYVYELFGPFIQYFEKLSNGDFKETLQPTEYKCHQTFGYIGQHMRYISLNQKNYNYKGIMIERPKHLIWRDGHTNTPAYNDSQWIKEFNRNCREAKKELYLIPVSAEYEQVWNDKVICTIDRSLVTRSAIAGIQQYANYTNSDRFIPYDIYCQSFGLPFIVDENNQLILMKERPNQHHEWAKKTYNRYMYGIDEYTLSSIFDIKYFKSKSIYLNHYFLWLSFTYRLLNYSGSDLINPKYAALCIVLYYLYKINTLEKDKCYNMYDIIRAIESIRYKNNVVNMPNIPNFQNKIGTLLGIIPTKWHYNHTIFSANETKTEVFQTNLINYNIVKEYVGIVTNKFGIYERIDNIYNCKEYDFTDVTDQEMENLFIDFMNNFSKYNITCNSTAISSPVEWCMRPYIYNNRVPNQNECPSTDYYSGFYDDTTPQLIGILRSPADLEKTIRDIDINKYQTKLELSAYQLANMENSFANVDDVNNGHIKAPIQNIIFSYTAPGEYCLSGSFGCKAYNIAIQASVIHNSMQDATQSAVWCPLIWKALLYSGYPVPFGWTKYNGQGDKQQLDILSQELTKIDGWDKFALVALNIDLNENLDNDFNEQNNQMANNITNMITNNNINGLTFEDFIKNKNINKLDQLGGKNSYINKYLKYKNKYVNLRQATL